MYEWHSFGGGVMWIIWILIVALLVWVVVTATRSAGSGGPAAGLALWLDVLVAIPLVLTCLYRRRPRRSDRP